MEIKYVAGVRLAAGGALEQQAHRTVGDGVLGQVVVDDEHVFALIHEVLRKRAAAVRREVLQRHRVVCRGRDDAGVRERAFIAQGVDDLGEGGGLLPDGDVDADDVLPLLVEDGVDGDGRLARLAVADDQLALAAADGDHTVDGEDARLQRLVDFGAVHDGGRGELDGAVLLRRDGGEAVDGVAERVDDAAEQFFAHAHLHRLARRVDEVAVAHLFCPRKKNGAHAELFKVERERVIPALNFEKLVVFYIFETADVDDAVARIGDAAARAIVLDLLHGIQLVEDPSSYFLNVDHILPVRGTRHNDCLMCSKRPRTEPSKIVSPMPMMMPPTIFGSMV